MNRARHDHREFAPVTAGQIHLHMTHRITACAILVLVAACAWLSRKGGNRVFDRLTAAWLALIVVQAFLGAYTVWSNKAADIATAHVAVGAISLVFGGLLYVGTGPMAVRAASRRLVAAPIPEGSAVLSS